MNTLNTNTVEGEPRDAASVVLLRDAVGRDTKALGSQAGDIEVFLLRRGGSTTVMNDAYVFPGGKVDEADASAMQISANNVPGGANALLGEQDLSPAKAASLFVAACRETFEECGVQLTASDLIPLSRWITPKVPAMMRKRFDTRFFIAVMPVGAVAVHDGQEADASVWCTPKVALERYRDGEIMLAPPQIMTLVGLLPHTSTSNLSTHLRKLTPRLIEPFPIQIDGERGMAYPGDHRHPIQERAMPGPSFLVYRNERFEPSEGFDSFFVNLSAKAT